MGTSVSIAAATRRVVQLTGIAFWVFSFPAACNPAQAAPSSALDIQITRLQDELEHLEAARAVKTLQRAWGYYIDRALWNEAADLFAPDATIEIGADGVYVGRARIREYLEQLAGGGVGLPWGRLSEHYQLQPVVHVSADGLSAKARWRDFALLGEYKTDAAWGDGIYENEYVKRDGVWMIKSMHLYVNFVAPFDKGWARLESPGTGKPTGHTFNFAGALQERSPDGRSAASRSLPPDRPSTSSPKGFPEAFVAPFHYRNPADVHDARAEKVAFKDPRLARYQHEVELLRDHDDVESLQAIYGYYFEKNLWDDLARLFTSDATFESGQSGVYVGRKHIREQLQLFGPAGPQRGWWNNYMQLQPVIHVAEDGRTAKARWESIMQISRPNSYAAWGLGVYENEYTREGDTWKISKLHFYVTALADYDRMWDKGPIPMEGPSAVLPPDRPPTEVYRSLPGVYIPPFHYRHPVTGKPIVTDPEPADSMIRPLGSER